MTTFEPLLDLMTLLGNNIKRKICVARNACYTSDKAVQEMVHILSEVIEKKLLHELKSADFISLMFNETTDCTVTEQIAVHARSKKAA